MKLDPVSLRLFVAVMEENAIARAAAREHIAPSAASRRLAELEDTLQVELFTRSNRGTEPTAAAYTLLNLARGVLNDLDGIAAQMLEYGAGVRGQVFARCCGGDGTFFHHGNKQAQGDGVEFHGGANRTAPPCRFAMAASRISVLRAGRVCA